MQGGFEVTLCFIHRIFHEELDALKAARTAGRLDPQTHVSTVFNNASRLHAGSHVGDNDSSSICTETPGTGAGVNHSFYLTENPT